MIGILIASTNRQSLRDCLISICSELRKTDRVLVVADGVDIDESVINDFKERVEFLKEPEKLGYYGHPIRQKYQDYFDTKYILNVDDDDVLNVGWRSMFDLYFRRDDWDIILWNFIDMRYHQQQYKTNNQTRPINPITGNVLFKNIPKFTSVPWYNYVGGDNVRVHEMLKDKRLKVAFSEFALFKKY